MIYARALGDALRALLSSDPRVILLGEDIVDPYGGAFKVTRGLSSQFPERVRSTPVSEGAVVGISGGLALAGMRPIVEIMFGDFMSLGFDQIVNHIVKYGPMYDHRVECSVVIRTPSGGGRGYGPTHSQSLEKHFFGVPALRVVAGSVFHDPLPTFEYFLGQDMPVLFIEHKLIYPLPVETPADIATRGFTVGHDADPGWLPTVTLSAVPREECTLTVVAYGYQATQGARLLERLALEEEIFVEMLIPAQIAPIDFGPVKRSVDVTGSLLTIEEGTAGWSWGSEIAEHVHRTHFRSLRHPVTVLASKPTVIPSARHLEQDVLVSVEQIEQGIRQAAR